MLHTRKATNLQTRDLTTRSLTVRSETLDEETRSVEAVLATEQVTTVFDWGRLELVDESLRMSGAQFGGQVPMLETHQRWSLDSILGSIRELKVEGSKLIGRLFFAEGDERAESAWRKVRQGHLTDVSIGYRVEKGGFRDISPGQAVTIDGKEIKAGTRVLRITTTWTLREGSLVPIGADDAAKIREEQSAGLPVAATKEIAMNKRLRAYLLGIGLRSKADEGEAQKFYDALSDSAKLKAQNATREESVIDLDATPEEEPNREAPKVEPEKSAKLDVAVSVEKTSDVERKAVEKDRERARKVRDLGRTTPGVPDEVIARAVDEGWSEGEAAQEYLAAIRDARAEPVRAPAGHAHSHDAECTERVLCAAMLHRGGLMKIDPKASNEKRWQQERLAEQSHRYRDMAMIDIAREGLRLSGINVPHSRDEIIRAAFSTSSMTNIFTTTANAALMQAYTEAEDTTRLWTREEEVPDYKLNERILIGKGGNLEQLPRGGSADHTDYSDLKEEYKAFRFAQQFVVDEMDIIDDRFGALLDRPAEIGNAAGRVRPDIVYYLLLANAALGADSIALFHADHNNLETGGAMTKAKVETGIIAMAKQTQDSVNLNISPKFMLLPQDLRFTAKIIMQSVQTAGSSTIGTLNPLLNEDISMISDNRLGVAGVTDPITGTVQAGSATAWYLAANPSQAPTIVVGFVRGTNKAPRMRSKILDGGQYGIQWDVVLSIGAKALDFRGLYKDDGV